MARQTTALPDSDAQPRILFIALANDIGMERLPAAMAKQGAVCAVLSPPGFYCTRTRFVSRRFALPHHRGIWLGAPFVRARLEAAVHAWRPDLLVPLDDIAALLLRKLPSTGPLTEGLRDLIAISLGAPQGYSAACSRAGLMEVAANLPIRLPRYHVAREPAATQRAADSWGYPVVLKAEHTCGGHGVVIAAAPEALRAALTAMSGRLTRWQRCRMAGRHWMWNLAGLSGTAGQPPLLQALVPGVPAMRTVVAWKGEVLEGASFVAERVHPAPTGPSTMVRHVEHPEMEDIARHLVAALGCSGFVSFDFILETWPEGVRRSPAHLIEMNPRPIGTTHLGRLFGHDLCAALLARLQGKPAPHAAASVRPDQLIALFPKELERDPNDPDRLHTGDILHDVPRDDSPIVETYVKRLSRVHARSAKAIASALAPECGQRPPAPDTSRLSSQTPRWKWI